MRLTSDLLRMQQPTCTHCAQGLDHTEQHMSYAHFDAPWTIPELKNKMIPLRAYILIQHPLSLSALSLVVSKHFWNPESLDLFNMLTVSTFCSWSSAPRQWEAKGSDRKSRRLVHKHPAINCEAKQVLAATGRYFEVCHFNCEAFRKFEPCRRDNLSI